jgi:predicted branched-subunit amino acid permease
MSPPPLPESPPPDPAPVSTAAAFLQGAKAAVSTVFVYVTIGTYLGIGALSHDLGFSLVWSVICTLLVWAGPAQVILISGLGGGAAQIEIAIAVALSGVRLMPMIVSIVPIMRGAGTRNRDLILPAHFIAVMIWSLGLQLLPKVPRENRVTFVIGMGTAFSIVAAAATVTGYYLAAGLPSVLTAALLMLTPLAFLMSIAGNARMLSDRLALALGLVIAPILAAYQVQLDLLWSGLIAGTLAFAAHRLREFLR